MKIRAHYRDRVVELPYRGLRLGQISSAIPVNPRRFGDASVERSVTALLDRQTVTLFLEAVSRDARALLAEAAGGPIEFRTAATPTGEDPRPGELVIHVPYFRPVTPVDHQRYPELPVGAFLAPEAWLGRERPQH